MTKPVSNSGKKKQDDIERVPCPFCKEPIIAGAKKCRFCNEFLDKIEKTEPKKLNFFTRKITPPGPYKIWVLSMLVFLFSIGQNQANSESEWWIVMLTSVAVGLVAFLTLVISIPGSKGRYGIITPFTFILFFCILFNYDAVATAFGLEPAFTKSSVREEETTLKSTSNPTPTTAPTNVPTKQSTLVNSVNTKQSNKIECIGPDGKQFTTTQKECDEFNAAWGNIPTPDPNEYIKCNISANCGGGYREMTRKTCEQMTCCQISGSWELREKGQCDKEQEQQSNDEWVEFCNDIYNPDTCSNFWLPGTTELYHCRTDAYSNRIRCYEDY